MFWGGGVWTSLVAQMVKHLPTMQETQSWSLGWEDPLENDMATHSSTLACKPHGRRSAVGYSPWGRKESDRTERLHFQFGHEACGILAPWRGTKPTPPALEGKVLTTGPPGKFLNLFFNRGNKSNDQWGPVCVCAAATAKSLQSCPTLCDPIHGSPWGSSIPGILQARTLEWVAISFSNAWKWEVTVKSLSCVQLFGPHGLQPTRLLHPRDFPGKSTGVGCHCLLQCVCVYSRVIF